MAYTLHAESTPTALLTSVLHAHQVQPWHAKRSQENSLQISWHAPGPGFPLGGGVGAGASVVGAGGAPSAPTKSSALVSPALKPVMAPRVASLSRSLITF